MVANSLVNGVVEGLEFNGYTWQENAVVKTNEETFECIFTESPLLWVRINHCC